MMSSGREFRIAEGIKVKTLLSEKLGIRTSGLEKNGTEEWEQKQEICKLLFS